MNRLNLTTAIVILLTIAACKKNVTADKTPAANASQAVEECQPPIYDLVVDSVTGFSYIFKVLGSPGAGPITVAPFIVSGTNQLTTCSGTPILFATGLAYDPAYHTFYGTTGIAGPTPNSIFKFMDPNCVTISSVINTCSIALNLSDVERDQTTGVYYAINRSTVAPNNRIVKLGVSGPFTVNCLPNPLPVSIHARGLTFNCNGQLYVMHTNGTSGILIFVDKATGLPGLTYPYPGPIAAAAVVPSPELGLHFDCGCTNRFITGSYNPFGGPLMTDGLPGGLGGPAYFPLLGGLKPTVDFARPN